MHRLLNLEEIRNATEDSLGAAREAYNTSSLENNKSGSTTDVTPLGANDPSSLRQPKYRHRRPRAYLESPNLQTPSNPYRSPHRSHKGGEFSIHLGTYSAGSVAKDSEDEAVQSNSEGHGHYELYDEWTNLPYPDGLVRPTASSPRQHWGTPRTKSVSPVRAPKLAIPPAVVLTSLFTSEDEGIDSTRTKTQKKKRRADKTTAKSQSQPHTRLEHHSIRRRLRFLRAQLLALESDLFFMDPGVINADILDRIESDLDDLLDLVKGIQGGNEQPPGGGKVGRAERT